MKKLRQWIAGKVRALYPVAIEKEVATPLEDWMCSALSRLPPGTSLATLLATGVVKGREVSIEDTAGLVKGLSKQLGVSRHQAFARCVEWARSDARFGAWRLFLVDEVLMGEQYQRLMASRE